MVRVPILPWLLALGSLRVMILSLSIYGFPPDTFELVVRPTIANVFLLLLVIQLPKQLILLGFTTISYHPRVDECLVNSNNSCGGALQEGLANSVEA